MQGLTTCSDYGYAPASKRAAGRNAIGPPLGLFALLSQMRK
jgi:hypothetical protein